MRKSNVKMKIGCMIFMLLAFCLVHVLAEPCGDVNSDGAIDILDALLIAQHYVGLDPANFDENAADVNADGVIDILDALLVAQYYVDLIPSLPGCDPTPTPEETEPTPTPECETLEKQAEDADYSSGSVDTNHAGYTGTGFVNTDNAAGEWIEWSVEVGNDCNATCVFRYASGGGARPMNLTINTGDDADLAFSGSSAWDDWQTETAEVILYTGLNAIRLTAIDSGGAPNMDKMDITICGGPVVTATPSPTPTPTPTPTQTPSPTPTCDGTCPPVELPIHWHETNGFGTSTIGGLAGEVYKVTNTNSSGPGSLSDALSDGNRLIVFEVGGVFNTDMDPENNTTVAGQTAPYPGVTCIGSLRMRGNNVVVSHVAVQYTGSGDAGSVGGSYNVLDHSSVYWGKDETITFEGGTNFTMYKSICAEGLQFTGHSDGEHSKGIFMKSTNDVSIISSMVVNNALRNPRVDFETCFLGNHVVYNHGPGWDHQGSKPSNDSELDLESCPHCFTKVVSAHYGTVTMVGSISLAGPESSPRAKYFLDGHNSTATGYVEDNIIKDIDGNDLFQANTEGEFTGGASGSSGAVTLLDTPPIWPPGYEPLPAHEALYEVLRTVGPHPGIRNYHAKRLIENVAYGTGAIIDDPSEVGGYANYPTSDPRPLTVPDGVEARQAWLDAWEDEIAVDRDIDLSRLYNELGIGTAASDKYGP